MNAEDDWLKAWRETFGKNNRSFDVSTSDGFIPRSTLASGRMHLRAENIRLLEDIEVPEDSVIRPLISHIDDQVMSFLYRELEDGLLFVSLVSW